jgi:predicted  nucleic acid-binding Zn-ribbon protein
MNERLQLASTIELNTEIIESKLRKLTLDVDVNFLPLDLPPGPPLVYDGRYDPKADELEAISKANFIKSDEAYYRATNGGKHIKINSGRRTVRHQADLWIGYREGRPGYNKANLPGCSLHNYGTAIDIIREGNVDWIEEALNKYGWERTVDDEGWHYECLVSPAHARVKPTIDSLRAGKAGQWAQAYFDARKQEEEQGAIGARLRPRIDKFNSDIDAFNAAAQRHNSEAESWKAQIEQWKADRAALQVRIDNFNQRVAYANDLAQKVNQLPPGDERNRLYNEWQQLSQQIEAERPGLDAAVQALNQRASALDQEGQRILDNKQKLEAELARLKQEQQGIESEINKSNELGRKASDNRNKMVSLLSEIEQIVG